MDWGGTISLKACIAAGPSLFEARLLLFGMGQSHVDVLSLDPGYLSLCTLRAGSRSLHVTRGICLSNFLTQSLSK